MTNQATIDYLKGRVVSAVPTISGEVTTHSTITFDNGVVVEGSAIRDISSYEKTEADAAAFQSAIASLVPGVAFILTKNS